MKKESDDQRRAWEDIKKAHTFAELMKALPIQLLERCAEIILSFWILSPLFILIRSAVLSGDDPFHRQIILSSTWYVFLEQAGFLALLVDAAFIGKERCASRPTHRFRAIWEGKEVLFWLLLLWCWSIISFLASDNPAQSFWGDSYRQDGLFSYSLYLGLYLLAFYVRAPGLMSHLTALFSLSAFPLALLTVLNNPALNTFFHIEQASSVFYNANHYAYYLCLSQMAALCMLLTQKPGTLSFWGYFSLFCVVGAALIQNGSLGPYLAVLSAMVLMLFWMRCWRLNGQKTVLLAVIAFLIVSFAISSNNHRLESDLVVLFHDAGLIVKGSEKASKAGSGRWILWQTAVRLIFQKPLTGFGPDNLGPAFKAYGLQTDRPHNELLQIAASLGLPALFFYLAAVFCYIAALYKKRRSLTPFHSGLAGMVAAYLISSLFGNTMFYTSPFFFLVLGLSSGALENLQEGFQKSFHGETEKTKWNWFPFKMRIWPF